MEAIRSIREDLVSVTSIDPEVQADLDAHPEEKELFATRVTKNLRHLGKKLTTKEGWFGKYDYAYLFVPAVPFLNRKPKTQPFFALHDEMPIFLGMLLGLQHALSMLAGLCTPPIIISGFANLSTIQEQYLVSVSLMVSGFLSAIQITRFHIPKTPYFLGTGLISVVGTSFATITIVTKGFPQMYKTGFCPSDADGNPLPCPDGYGAVLATSAVCGILEVVLSFMPPAILQKIFPPLVTGPVVLLIGVSLVQSSFQDLAGGSGCVTSNVCAKGLPWGSAQFVGLGFLVFVTIIFCEKWGSPIMKSCAVICGLLVGCIVGAACGYFTSESIDMAPAATFVWVHTFKLRIYAPMVLPFLACYIVLMMEAIGDITASSDVSRLEISGPLYESRVQGGVLADGCNGILAALMTLPPMSTFAQNNGVIAITKCAARTVGYWCCFFLVVMGVFSKFAAALVSIPSAILGGMTSFLFTSVSVSGLKIISSIPFTRRDRFVLTCSLMFGLGATLVGDWFEHVFTYTGDNKSLEGFMNAIVLVMETGFALAGFIGVILNLFIPQELDEDDEADHMIEEQIVETSSIQGSSENEKKDSEKKYEQV
ncbi:DEKNAAC103671 [Brettanomyces naardenensis]|uniref:DEKNAAC103671 n=1 Tax=Brettanomyces naardenensis TaxID=13370 RepID=A0A448YNE7_BRENA|nr:DEKNAAC103671 [Brettanomyces naardenensis]